MTETNNESDGRLSFMEAVALAMRPGQASFCAVPVFGDDGTDDGQTAEGARIFIVEPDPEAGDWRLRFVAGPFFANVYAANEIVAPEEVPPNVRELRFLPVRFEERWLDEQMQVLVQRLAQASGVSGDMPDYENMPSRAATEETVFPVSFIGRGDKAP